MIDKTTNKKYSMTIEDVISILKEDIDNFYFHRNWHSGKIEFNIEFKKTEKAQKLIDNDEVEEIDRCAFWE